MRAFRVLMAIGIAAALGCARPAAAEDYPAREIHSVCNFAAGSGADIVVRWYSGELAKRAGKPVVVENKPGAQGNIATDYTAHAKPDGYTILITPASSTLGAVPHLFKTLSFDPIKDFAPVGTLAKAAFVVGVDAAGPIRSLPELTVHLRTKPGDGSYGTGSNTGIGAAELYKQMAGLKTQRVPYRDPGTALTDLLGGQIDFMFDPGVALPHVKSGKLRLLAVGSPKRHAAFPDTPTVSEVLGEEFDAGTVFGVLVPAGTPKAVTARLNAEIARIMQTSEMTQRIAALGAEPLYLAPEAYAARLRGINANMVVLVRETGMKAE